MLYGLVEGIQRKMKVREKFLREMTSQANIAYLPSGFGTLKSALKTLARMKKAWNINVMESEKNYDVDFEDKLKVRVPKMYAKHFQEKSTIKLQSGLIELSAYLKEARDDDQLDRYDALENAFYRAVSESPIVDAEAALAYWKTVFGQPPTITKPANALLSFSNLEKDIAEAIGHVKEAYDGDAGYVDMIIESLNEKSPLNAYDSFNKFETLIEETDTAVYEGVRVSYTVSVDPTFKTKQFIIVEDEDVVADASGRSYVKVSGSSIYPVGNWFRPGFFRELKRFISDVVEAREAEVAKDVKKGAKEQPPEGEKK